MVKSPEQPQLDADWPERKQWPDTAAGRFMAGLEREQRVRTAAARAEWESRIPPLREAAAAAKVAFDESLATKAPYSRQVTARTAAIAAYQTLRNAQASPPAPHRASVPTKQIGDVAAGEVARIPGFRCEVFQVLDGGALFRAADGLIWVAMPTTGLVDGRVVTLTGVAEGLGTKRYETAIGGTKTVWAVRLHQLRDLPLPDPIPPQTADAVPELPVPFRDPVVPPSATWSSKWEQRGAIKARVAGVHFAPPPLVDAKGDRTPGPEKVLMVWVQLENTGATERGYRRYQEGSVCVLAGEDRVPHLAPTWPPGLVLDYVNALDQKLRPGVSVTTLVTFRRPAPPTGELRLGLDASRVGEPGQFVFWIPASAWVR